MTTRTIGTRWRGIALGTALVVIGSLGAADAFCAVEEPPVAGAQVGQGLAQDLRRAADSEDWEAIEQSLVELESRLEATASTVELPRVRSRHEERRRFRFRHELRIEPPPGHPGASWDRPWEHFGERVGRHWGRFGERIGRRCEHFGERMGRQLGRFGERMGRHWGRFGERIGERGAAWGDRMGEHWGEFGGRTGERWGEFGGDVGERWGSIGERGWHAGRVGDQVGERFGEVGSSLPDVIDLSIETAVDAVATLADSLDRR